MAAIEPALREIVGRPARPDRRRGRRRLLRRVHAPAAGLRLRRVLQPDARARDGDPRGDARVRRRRAALRARGREADEPRPLRHRADDHRRCAVPSRSTRPTTRRAACSRRASTASRCPRTCCSGRSGSSSSSGWSRRASSSGAWSSTSPSTPSCRRSCAPIPSLVPAAVEEYLRLLTPYRGFARTPTRDVEIGGRLIRKDEPVALVYASANRDESVFPEPERFVLDRPNIGRHLAFGAGPAPLRRRAARDADAAGDARGAARAHVVDRARGRGDDDRLARVGDAVRAPTRLRERAAETPTSTRSTRSSSRDPHAVWARLRADAPSRAARAGTSGRSRATTTSSPRARARATSRARRGSSCRANPVSGRRAPLHFDPPEHPRYRRPLNARARRGARRPRSSRRCASSRSS